MGEVHYPKTDVGGKPCYEVKYKIFFVGDNTNCVLSQKHTRRFETSFLEFAFVPKTKRILQHSIKKACYLYEKTNPGL